MMLCVLVCALTSKMHLGLGLLHEVRFQLKVESEARKHRLRYNKETQGGVQGA